MRVLFLAYELEFCWSGLPKYECEEAGCGSVNWKMDFDAFKSQTTIFPFSLALARI